VTSELSLWLKIAYTTFVAVLVPVYWRHYGPSNFLWFSDVALLLTVAALWLESSLLASMMTLAVALPELVWNVDFFARVLTRRSPIGLAAYMWDPRIPVPVRGLSLFHIFLPALLLWLVARLGYDRRAWLAQSVLSTVVLLATWLFTDPAKNINWAFGPGDEPQARLSPALYLAIVVAFFPLVVYGPLHYVLGRLFSRAG
jgi:hypothetical protein